MSLRKTLILLILLIAASVYVYKTEFIDVQKEEEAEQASMKIFDFQNEAVTGIRIKGKENDFTLKRAGSKWMVESPVTTSADDAQVKKLLDTVTGERALEFIGNRGEGESEDLSVFGLMPPEWALEFSVNGRNEPQFLHLGRMTPGGGKVYARSSKLQKVFVAQGFFKKRAGKTLFDLRNKRLFDDMPPDVEKVEYTGGDTHVVMEKKGDGAWRLTEPFNDLADELEVLVLIGKVLNATAIKFADATLDESKAGLKPAVRTVKLFMAGEDEPLVLYTGVLSTDGKGIWATRGGDYPIAALDAQFWSILAQTALEFRDKRLLRVKAEDLSSVKIERGAGGYELAAKDGIWSVEGYDGPQLDHGEIKDFVSIIASADHSGFLDGSRLNFDWSQPPVIKITVELKGKKPATHTVSIYNYIDDKNMMIAKSDIYVPPLTIKKEIFNRLLREVKDFTAPKGIPGAALKHFEDIQK